MAWQDRMHHELPAVFDSVGHTPCRLVGRGSVQYPLEGKPCLTMYQVLGHTRSARHNWVTTVKLHPHTGAPQSSKLCLHASRHCPPWMALAASRSALKLLTAYRLCAACGQLVRSHFDNFSALSCLGRPCMLQGQPPGASQIC